MTIDQIFQAFLISFQALTHVYQVPYNIKSLNSLVIHFIHSFEKGRYHHVTVNYFITQFINLNCWLIQQEVLKHFDEHN